MTRFGYATGVNVPDLMIRSGVRYRIFSDHVGSPRMVVRDDGVIVARWDYDEFGRRTAAAGNSVDLPFGFAGGLYDADTGLVRFGARDYDPVTGRWTAKDPIGHAGGLNLYVYAGNAPIGIVDATGLIGLGDGASVDRVITHGAVPLTGKSLDGDSGDFAVGLNVALSWLPWRSYGWGDWFDVFAHGSPTGMDLHALGVNGSNAAEVADLIRRQPGYTPGMPVRLNSCNTGNIGAGAQMTIARELSLELGVPVAAPNGFLNPYGMIFSPSYCGMNGECGGFGDAGGWNIFVGGELL